MHLKMVFEIKDFRLYTGGPLCKYKTLCSAWPGKVWPFLKKVTWPNKNFCCFRNFYIKMNTFQGCSHSKSIFRLKSTPSTFTMHTWSVWQWHWHHMQNVIFEKLCKFKSTFGFGTGRMFSWKISSKISWYCAFNYERMDWYKVTMH
jgi:hypothetical protein